MLRFANGFFLALAFSSKPDELSELSTAVQTRVSTPCFPSLTGQDSVDYRVASYL